MERRISSDLYHRHLSHLYELHPGAGIASKTPHLEKLLKSLEVRGDDGSGWSIVWRMIMWARLRDAEHAKRIIGMFLRPVDANTETNLLGACTAADYAAHPPFQIGPRRLDSSGLVRDACPKPRWLDSHSSGPAEIGMRTFHALRARRRNPVDTRPWTGSRQLKYTLRCSKPTEITLNVLGIWDVRYLRISHSRDASGVNVLRYIRYEMLRTVFP